MSLVCDSRLACQLLRWQKREFFHFLTVHLPGEGEVVYFDVKAKPLPLKGTLYFLIRAEPLYDVTGLETVTFLPIACLE